VPLDRTSFAQARTLAPPPDWLVFHAAEEREASLRMLAALATAAPATRIVVVVGRHQGPQISYLLAAGAHRCMVEPIYPGELAALLAAEA
jgi:AmiR/NasT family two-component response regulator